MSVSLLLTFVSLHCLRHIVPDNAIKFIKIMLYHIFLFPSYFRTYLMNLDLFYIFLANTCCLLFIILSSHSQIERLICFPEYLCETQLIRSVFH